MLTEARRPISRVEPRQDTGMPENPFPEKKFSRAQLDGQIHKIGEQVISDAGTFQHVIEYFDGWHPELKGGRFHRGWQGEPQTSLERDVIRSIYVIEVKPK